MNAKALIAGGAAALLLTGAALAQPPAARRPDPLAGKTVSVLLVTDEGVTLSEDDHGVANTRSMKFGEEYAPGWTLQRPTPMGIGLKNGQNVRVIPYAQGAAPSVASGDPAAAGQVNLSNAVAGERSARTGQVLDRAKLITAVKAGDAKQAYELGGSAKDVAEAVATSMNNPRIAEMLASGGQASFVNMNGSTGVRVSSGNQDGRNMQMVMVPPQLQGVAPPADAEVMIPPNLQPGAQVTNDGNGNISVRRTIPAPAPGQ